MVGTTETQSLVGATKGEEENIANEANCTLESLGRFPDAHRRLSPSH